MSHGGTADITIDAKSQEVQNTQVKGFFGRYAHS
jgi:hypothetical protein